MFIMVDGIDGSGKTSVVQAFARRAEKLGKKVFDVVGYQKDHIDLPHYEDVANYDVLLTSEPTRTWVGAAIRKEMLKLDASYEPQELAEAYALDRLVFYRRLILPALAAQKTVVQDRGFTTSLVYQTAMEGGLATDAVLALPGNALAMAHLPDHLFLCLLPPDVAMSRIHARDGKPTHRFEDMDAMTRFDTRYRSDWLDKIFEGRRTKIHRLDMNQSMEETTKSLDEIAFKIL